MFFITVPYTVNNIDESHIFSANNIDRLEPALDDMNAFLKDESDEDEDSMRVAFEKTFPRGLQIYHECQDRFVKYLRKF